MKVRFLFLLLFLLSLTFNVQESKAQGRNFYGFKDIEHGHARIGMAKQISYAPDDYYADIKGGFMEIFVAKGQCSDKYRFTWKFLDDISKMEPGKVYRAELNAERVEGNCNQNEAYAQMYGSNENCRLCSDRGLGKSSFSLAVKAKGDERIYAVPKDYPHATTYELSVSRVDTEEPYILLSFSCTTNPSPKENFDYQIVYKFGKNYQPITGSIGFDCQMLYPIGTNLAFLEKVAEENGDMETALAFLGEAINYVRATNCLKDDYLVDLMDRMHHGSDKTNTYFEEIKAYRKKLPSIIPADCID